MNLEIEACQDFQNSMFGVNQADNGPASHAKHNFMCLLIMQQLTNLTVPLRDLYFQATPHPQGNVQVDNVQMLTPNYQLSALHGFMSA